MVVQLFIMERMHIIKILISFGLIMMKVLYLIDIFTIVINYSLGLRQQVEQ